MLYQIYDAQRAILEPFADLAHATAKMFTSPAYPLSHVPGADRVAAGYELFHRLGKDYEKPEFNIQQIEVDGQEVAIFERIEIDKPFCELRRFKRFSDDAETLNTLKGQPTVLIVAPLSGHYATLLRDTVRTMLVDHKVYITDWRNARLVPTDEGVFHLDDYIAYVQEFIRHLIAKYDHCHVLAVCQPTVPVLAAVSLMASNKEQLPLSMTLMGGPLDARKSPTAVNDLATERSHEWFMNNVIYRVPPGYPGEGRQVYPGFLQHAGFVAMNPDRHAQSHYDFFEHLIAGNDESADAHRKFYDEYNAVLDMDAAYYLETIKTVFQKFSLVNGDWDVRTPQGKIERVKPADITTAALLTVEGELDDITGPGQSEAAHDMCASIPAKWKHHLMVEKAGHYGIFSGRRWREVAYPKVRTFIAEAHHRGEANYKASGLANPYDLGAAKAAYAAKQVPASAFNDARTTTAPVAATPTAAVSQPATKRPAPAARKTAKATVKATVTKAVSKTAAKPATKPTAKPTAKVAVAKTVTKTAAKPAAPKGVVTAKKPVAKPVAKPAAKPASKATTKPATKSAAKPAATVATTKPVTTWAKTPAVAVEAAKPVTTPVTQTATAVAAPKPVITPVSKPVAAVAAVKPTTQPVSAPAVEKPAVAAATTPAVAVSNAPVAAAPKNAAP